MFGHHYFNNNTLYDGRRTLTLFEKVNRFKTSLLASREKRIRYVNPDRTGQFFTATPAQVAQQNLNNDIFTTWESIYSKFRNQARISFLMPACAKFYSLSAVQKYVASNPTGRAAASLDFARQICALKNNPNHLIVLQPNTLAYWNNNSGLKDIVNSAAPHFYSRLEIPTVTHMQHNP